MSQKNNKYILGVVLLLVLSACGGQNELVEINNDANGAEANSGSADQSEGLEGFAAALENAGAEVELSGETLQQPFFDVQAQVVFVNGADMQVFEFAGEPEASSAAAQVSPDGSSVGTTMISWIAAPHFFQWQNLIIIYLGEDTAVLDTLQSVAGDEFAGR